MAKSWVPSADGTTDFAVLQNDLKGRSTRIVLVAFDLLYLNGQDLRRLPLTTRKAELKTILAGSEIQFSEMTSAADLRRRLLAAIDPQNAALRQAHCPSGRLGGAQAAGRNRIPREIGRG